MPHYNGREVAELLRISQSRVSQYAKAGRITRGEDGMFSEAEVTRLRRSIDAAYRPTIVRDKGGGLRVAAYAKLKSS